MRRILSVVLALFMLFIPRSPAACAEKYSFKGLNDQNLHRYLEETVYEQLITELNSEELFISDVQTVYISQEYLDELAFNSQKNVYFGYTLAELEAAYQGKKYVFTLGENGQTIVKEFEEYTDISKQLIANVAMGTGVILICVTVSAVTAPIAGAAAVNMIFAVAAKTGTACALSGAVLGGVSSGIVKGIKTGDMNQALSAAAVGASEGFKWGAITGAVTGAAGETIGLFKARLNGLTMNEAAFIQKDSKLPLEMIKNMHSLQEYELYKEAGLQPIEIQGVLAYGQQVDLHAIDGSGLTNAQRIEKGLSPLDPNGAAYELHHIGQAQDSPLAILTQEQHRGAGNFSVLHTNTGSAASEIDREIFTPERQQFWMNYLEAFDAV